MLRRGACFWRHDGVTQGAVWTQPVQREGAELSDVIGAVHAKFPRASIQLTSDVSVHHDPIYFTWQMIAGDRTIMINGVDFGTLAGDGRLQKIVGSGPINPTRSVFQSFPLTRRICAGIVPLIQTDVPQSAGKIRQTQRAIL